jgi:hypothetical protein
MINYRLSAGIFVCLFSFALVAEPGGTKRERGDPQGMEALFAELQHLASARTTPVDHAAALEHLKRESEIEHEYINRGAEATTFLLNKLSAINKREGTFIHGPDDFEGGVQFMASEFEAGRTLLMRYAICYILSDMYSKANASQRQQIIQGIVDSYPQRMGEKMSKQWTVPSFGWERMA